MNSLLSSRRFLTMCFGIVVALVLYFAAKYLPAGLEDIQFLINTLTPLVIGLIAAFTVDEAIKTLRQAQVEMHAASLNAQAAMYAATLNAPRREVNTADDAALMRPKANTTRLWACPFVNGDKPNYFAYTAEDLIEHMVKHHQNAWSAATGEWERKKQIAQEDKQTE